YKRLTGGGQARKKPAVVALARKILVRCWAMLRDGVPWRDDPQPKLAGARGDWVATGWHWDGGGRNQSQPGGPCPPARSLLWGIDADASMAPAERMGGGAYGMSGAGRRPVTPDSRVRSSRGLTGPRSCPVGSSGSGVVLPLRTQNE